MPRKKRASFEENLQELENIVVRLEKGQSPLADIVADYTKGMELSAKCMDALKQAEKKMDIVLQESSKGEIVEKQLIIEGEQ